MSLPDTVSPSEQLSRFIYQKSYYRPSDKTVRYNAFMPNQRGETSVYRTTDLTSQQVYEIGQRHVAEAVGKSLLGRADVISSIILGRNLTVEPRPTPHYRHANIVGWPEDKSKHKEIALQIAAEARLDLIIPNNT